MTPKTKADAGEFATADDMATVLETLADLSERVEHVERVQLDADRRAAAGRPGAGDPVFMATTGRGGRARQSEGARQDSIEQENARAHLFEPAGDGVVTGAITSGTPEPAAVVVDDGEPLDERATVDTDDTAALNS